MDRDAFWNTVDAIALKPPDSLPAEDELTAFSRALKKSLGLLTPKQLEEFQDQLQLAVGDAYTSELYGAHYLVNGGGSLDGFYYFRAWLVAQGRQVYSTALKDPDSLAGVCAIEGVVADYEYAELLVVARDLYESKTGDEMDWRSDPGDLDQVMPGKEWEDEDDLREILPHLAAIHLDSHS